MFIKEGKTNIKYLLIVIILAAIVGGGILRLITKQKILFTQLYEIRKPEAFLSHGDFQYEMKTCEGRDEFKNNSINIEVLNNSIKFNQILNIYCNADKDNLKLEYKGEGNDLEINEIFDSTLIAKCVCPIEITGEIFNLEKGNYKITFVFDNKYTNQKEVLDTLGFEIK